MPSCIPKSKHVKLTLACYPKSKAAPAKPNSSELQYLAFYASSRPKKLIKVGAYIRQKTTNDAYRAKESDIIVSLDICSTLIEKCHANLSLFAMDLLAILRSALETRNPSLLEHSYSCFAMFAKYHDGSSLVTDVSYTKSYEALLNLFGDIACGRLRPSNDHDRLLGLEAILCASTSPALQALNNQAQLRLIMPTILSSISSVKEELMYSIRQQMDKRAAQVLERQPSLISNGTVPRIPAQTDESVTRAAPENIHFRAFEILQTIFDTNDAIQIRFASLQILEFQDDHDVVQMSWTSTLIQIVAEWAPINLRFHILSACLDRLLTYPRSIWPTARHTNLLSIIHGLLVSRVNLIGLSVVDVLDSLLSLGSTMIQHSDTLQIAEILTHLAVVEPGNQAKELTSIRTRFLQELTRTIVAITAHSYYLEQIPDMIQSVLQRLSVPLDDAPEAVTQKLFLLDTAIHLLQRAELRQDSVEARSKIPIDILEPSLNLLLHSDLALRRKSAGLCLHFIDVEYSRQSNHVVDHANTSDFSTLHILQTLLYRHARQYASSPADQTISRTLFRSIAISVPTHNLSGFLQMLYRLDQDRATEEALNRTEIVALINFATAEILVAHGIALVDIESMQSESEAVPPLFELLSRFPEVSKSGSTLYNSVWTDAWSPYHVSDEVGRDNSLKMPHKSGLLSSVAASREHSDYVITPPNDSTELGRIAELRQNLLEGSTHNIAPAIVQVDDSYGPRDLEVFFEGIELQPQSSRIVRDAHPRTDPIELHAQNVVLVESEDNLTIDGPMSDSMGLDVTLGKVVA